MALMPPLVTIMVKAAESASRSLARDFGEADALQISLKGPSDFVSAADKKAEKSIHHSLSKSRPDWSFLMEESGRVEGKDPNKVFIIDPLDGTNNFLHGVPHWCITMAAVENGEIVAGVTFDVIRNEMFWAAKGVGAFIHNRKIRAASRKQMDMGLVAGSLPSKGRRDHKASEKDVSKMTDHFSGIRSTGSAGLDLAYVAAGRFDGFWQREISPWDVAAGILLVREAGGRVTEIDGGKDPLNGGSILATSAPLYQDIHKLLN